MGKIDDMRKLREKQFEDAQRAAAKHSTNGVSKKSEVAPAKEEVAPVAEVAVARSSSRRNNEVTEGRCPACNKIKPVQNGMLIPHQKGLGKMCVGSRKEPL